MAITMTRSGLFNGLRARLRRAKASQREPLLHEPLFPSAFAWGAHDPRDAWMPSFEVRENPEAIWFFADLPGVAQGDLALELTGNNLVVSGRRDRAEDERFHTCERAFGRFRRSFSLPTYADLDHITSELVDGVLTIVVPKLDTTRHRKLPIGRPRARA
jgi:HSP20 family molecular chaperone IbpA